MPNNIKISKCNSTAIEIRFIKYSPVSFTTTVSLSFIENLNQTYVLFVLGLCGPVTTYDAKNTKYKLRKKLLQYAQQRTKNKL